MYYHIKYNGEDFPDIIYWSSHTLEEEITYHSEYHPDAEITIYSTDDVISKKLLTLTNQLFEHLKSQQQEPPYTITTEDYSNGYFVFDYGPNTVVHFRLKETPGWLYGIWWGLQIDAEDKVSIVGKFFAQYENEIDKFKPSASYYVCDMEVIMAADGSVCLDEGEVVSIINFIRDHPYRAWYGNINFNDEVSGFKAWCRYQKRQRWHRKKKRLQRHVYQDACRFAKMASRLLPYTNNITVEDYGEEGISPRYFFQLIATPDEEFEVNGFYDLWSKDDVLGKRYSRFKKHYDRYCKQGFILLDLPYDEVYVEIQQQQGKESTNQ